MPIATGKWQPFMEQAVGKLETGLKNRLKNAMYPKYVTVTNTNKLIERVQDIENMGGLRFWTEGSPRQELDYDLGWPQSFHQHQWSGMVDVTKVMQKFGDPMLVRRLYSQLADASSVTKELLGTYYLEYGATAVASVPTVGGLPIINAKGGDGLALFSASHTWRSGVATWSNYSSSSDDLTESAINSNTLTIRRWKDNQGSPLMVQPTGLIIPPDLEMKYHKIFESKLEPATANNAVNTAPLFVQGNCTVNPWLSDLADWYITTDAKDSGIIFYFGWSDEVTPDQLNVRTGNKATAIDFSLAHGAHNLRKIFAVK